MCVVCVSIKRLKRVARRAVWVSSRVHAWRGASRLMHARHTRVRVPHSSLLPCTEPPELRVPRRADLGRGPTQNASAPCAERRRRRPRRVGPSGFVCGRHVDRGDEHMSPRAPPSNPGRHAHRAQTQGRHTGVRPRAPDIACPPHTPCIKIMINILRALKRRWILIELLSLFRA